MLCEHARYARWRIGWYVVSLSETSLDILYTALSMYIRSSHRVPKKRATFSSPPSGFGFSSEVKEKIRVNHHIIMLATFEQSIQPQNSNFRSQAILEAQAFTSRNKTVMVVWCHWSEYIDRKGLLNRAQKSKIQLELLSAYDTGYLWATHASHIPSPLHRPTLTLESWLAPSSDFGGADIEKSLLAAPVWSLVVTNRLWLLMVWLGFLCAVLIKFNTYVSLIVYDLIATVRILAQIFSIFSLMAETTTKQIFFVDDGAEV